MDTAPKSETAYRQASSAPAPVEFAQPALASLFFVSFVLLGTMIILNLFIGVIMTGMGRDGLKGCELLKERGGTVFAQHQDGCTVYGMPKAVVEAEVGSVMCAYNSLGGAFSCENEEILTDILKGDWEFPGFVQSDFFAMKSTAPSANAGLDLDQDRAVRVDPGRQALLAIGPLCDERVWCIDAGMDDYIAKPLRVEEIVAALKRSKLVNPKELEKNE